MKALKTCGVLMMTPRADKRNASIVQMRPVGIGDFKRKTSRRLKGRPVFVWLGDMNRNLCPKDCWPAES